MRFTQLTFKNASQMSGMNVALLPLKLKEKTLKSPKWALLLLWGWRMDVRMDGG